MQPILRHAAIYTEALRELICSWIPILGSVLRTNVSTMLEGVPRSDRFLFISGTLPYTSHVGRQSALLAVVSGLVALLTMDGFTQVSGEWGRITTYPSLAATMLII